MSTLYGSWPAIGADYAESSHRREGRKRLRHVNVAIRRLVVAAFDDRHPPAIRARCRERALWAAPEAHQRTALRRWFFGGETPSVREVMGVFP